MNINATNLIETSDTAVVSVASAIPCRSGSIRCGQSLGGLHHAHVRGIEDGCSALPTATTDANRRETRQYEQEENSCAGSSREEPEASVGTSSSGWSRWATYPTRCSLKLKPVHQEGDGTQVLWLSLFL